MAGKGQQQMSPQMERVIKRLQLGFEEMQTNFEEFNELLEQMGGGMQGSGSRGNPEEDDDEDDEDEDDENSRQNNGQGRVKDPKHDKRLKQNQGRSA